VKALGSPNVLVNNAGVFRFEPFTEITENEFHREFNTNVLGPIAYDSGKLKTLPQAAAASSISARSQAKIPSPTPRSILRPRALSTG